MVYENPKRKTSLTRVKPIESPRSASVPRNQSPPGSNRSKPRPPIPPLFARFARPQSAPKSRLAEVSPRSQSYRDPQLSSPRRQTVGLRRSGSGNGAPAPGVPVFRNHSLSMSHASISNADDEDLERMVDSEIGVLDKQSSMSTGGVPTKSSRRWGSMDNSASPTALQQVHRSTSLRSGLKTVSLIDSETSSAEQPRARTSLHVRQKSTPNISRPSPHRNSGAGLPSSSNHIHTNTTSISANSDPSTPRSSGDFANALQKCVGAASALTNVLACIDPSATKSSAVPTIIGETLTILINLTPHLVASTAQLRKLWGITASPSITAKSSPMQMPMTPTTPATPIALNNTLSNPARRLSVDRVRGIQRVGNTPLTATSAQNSPRQTTHPLHKSDETSGATGALIFDETELRRENVEEALAYAQLHQQALSRMLASNDGSARFSAPAYSPQFLPASPQTISLTLPHHITTTQQPPLQEITPPNTTAIRRTSTSTTTTTTSAAATVSSMLSAPTVQPPPPPITTPPAIWPTTTQILPPNWKPQNSDDMFQTWKSVVSVETPGFVAELAVDSSDDDDSDGDFAHKNQKLVEVRIPPGDYQSPAKPKH